MKLYVNATSRAKYGNPETEPVSEKPSLTVPGMTLSLRDLIDRYTTGRDVRVLPGVYNGDEDLPDFERMTEQERIDYSRDLKQGIEQTRTSLFQKVKDRVAAAKAAAEAQNQNEPTQTSD